MSGQAPKCSDCQCWSPLPAEQQLDQQPDQEPQGSCRRHPPVTMPITVDGQFSPMTVWPRTGAGDGCWDFVSQPKQRGGTPIGGCGLPDAVVSFLDKNGCVTLEDAACWTFLELSMLCGPSIRGIVMTKLDEYGLKLGTRS